MENETMSLVGGLMMFKALENKRYKSDTSPYGRKVRFLNKNGYDAELENARRYFKEGQILTINEILVDKFSSEVVFVECPGKKFNTVMFADVKEENKFNIGDEIKIIYAGIGATGCNGRVGYVTEMTRTCGLAPMDKGFNVLLKDKVYKYSEGDEVWRVALDGEYELIKTIMPEKKIEKPTPKQKAEVIVYEQQPLIYTTLAKYRNGELIETQSNKYKKKSCKAIYNGLTTIVILDDGSKGIARCNPKDKYDKGTGFRIAFYRAEIRSLEKELENLCENTDIVWATKQIDKQFSRLAKLSSYLK